MESIYPSTFFQTAVEEKQGISQLERVVEEISEAERAKEQRKENKRLKKKKRKENKAKLNEEKVTEEKSEIVEEEEEEEKCAITTNGAEYEDSCDGSEKSSSELVVSPRKTDKQEENSLIQSDNSSKLSPVTNSSEDTQLTEMIECSDNESSGSISTKDSDSKCNDKPDLSPKCNHDESNAIDNNGSGTYKTVSKYNKNGYNNNCSKDSLSPETNGNQNGKGCNDSKGYDANHYSKHNGEEGTNYQGSKHDPCKCDKETSKPKSRNGFTNHQSDYRNSNNSNYKVHNGHKKNGYIDCRNCSTVGPRFSRYDDKWKSNSNEYVGDVYDKYHNNMNGNAPPGRGRGKRRGGGGSGGKYKVSTLLGTLSDSFTVLYIQCKEKAFQ